MSKPEKKTHTLKLGSLELTFETGQIARQAGGAVLIRLGDTVVFSTACAKKEAAEDADFFPLRVDYQEKFSSAGKTLGGFIKREGRPSEKEILMSRLIDRPLRPMFPEGYLNEVQVLSYVLSFDGIHLPEPLAICAASAALVLSEIPLVKPVGAVRVGRVNSQFIINPTSEQKNQSDLELLIAGTKDAVLMIEGYCDFLTEEEVLEAIAKGQEAIAHICTFLESWQQQLGKPKHLGTLQLVPEHIQHERLAPFKDRMREAIRVQEKGAREEALALIEAEFLATFQESPSDVSPFLQYQAFKTLTSDLMRKEILDHGVRPDGRTSDQIRQITIEQSLLPRTHGSSLFTRGETQSLAVCTLGGQNMGQRFEDLQGEGVQNFYLQYSFPPFSVGEVGRQGPPGRREVGHGKLAERALVPVIPSKKDFPYTIRIESNITESNGSSSMASVCGGCLAMMDAAVPIKRPIAGIAMGLILEESRFVVLSDILGIEDALGDMDFKVTGDDQGITAFQMDIKVEGITAEVMRQALNQAKQGRTQILEQMMQVCPKPKEEMSHFAPRIVTIQVNPSKIGLIIGPSGKQIRQIVEETGAEVDINDSGEVLIISPNRESVDQALAMIRNITAEVEVGKTYHGTITSIKDFGLFVELIPGKEGLCHISEFSHQRTQTLEGLVKVGDKISVKVLEINNRGQYRLSRKATLAAAPAS